MCRLVKALYSHPESGAHWEAHLTKAVKLLGGEPIWNFPSNFWFEERRLLLTVYVDDLLLSGPIESQAEVWRMIRSKVDVEDPEPLDRYLGRTHIVAPLPKPSGGC